ncbi:glutamine synthetase [Pelotomaculum thermopropionicum SI]|uniref:Glutamine synthetase n=1 Tax=Pelotomaculum thermopropionicum (strain DSM 13744 / JCM 10971 / SI) TaxID=370438 RepID=A5CZX4_PELTS|nr:glutamine synthetase [Pelotomaculum thermopropionicum SI]
MTKIDTGILKSMIDRGEIDTVIIAAADMQSRFFGKRCCADFFLSEAVHGINICSNNLIWDIELNEGGQYPLAGRRTGLPDLRAVPDMTTLRLYPWFEKTVLVMADLFHQDGTTVTIAPRNILKRQVEKAGNMGLQADMAAEIEFYIFNETAETARDKRYRELLPLSRMPAESIHQSSRYEHFLGKVRRYLNGAGVEVELARPERGRGQAEVNLRYTGALEMADRTAIYKNGIKEMADLEKLAVTFMAKYKTEEPASGFHVHLSLRDQKGNNIFYDENDEHGMSATCKHFLAGMITLAPELMCFYAPYINSYKRYGSTFGAPRNLSWGFDNRTLSFRVIGRGKSFRIENRIPGADANPYLVLAACLASGLYGIENETALPSPPVRGSAYEMRELRVLPASLMDALADFENSETARALFGREVIDHYALAAKQEIECFLKSVTDWERRRNFEQV